MNALDRRESHQASGAHFINSYTRIGWAPRSWVRRRKWRGQNLFFGFFCILCLLCVGCLVSCTRHKYMYNHWLRDNNVSVVYHKLLNIRLGRASERIIYLNVGLLQFSLYGKIFHLESLNTPSLLPSPEHFFRHIFYFTLFFLFFGRFVFPLLLGLGLPAALGSLVFPPLLARLVPHNSLVDTNFYNLLIYFLVVLQNDYDAKYVHIILIKHSKWITLINPEGYNLEAVTLLLH